MENGVLLSSTLWPVEHSTMHAGVINRLLKAVGGCLSRSHCGARFNVVVAVSKVSAMFSIEAELLTLMQIVIRDGRPVCAALPDYRDLDSLIGQDSKPLTNGFARPVRTDGSLKLWKVGLECWLGSGKGLVMQLIKVVIPNAFNSCKSKKCAFHFQAVTMWLKMSSCSLHSMCTMHGGHVSHSERVSVSNKMLLSMGCIQPIDFPVSRKITHCPGNDYQSVLLSV